ncbi:sodium-dependent phosphate transporter 1 [Cyclospora cayetanensis]|uniref:Sodium-dependent phosphate transporter 1 n=1 Tax=Cyclospora cayetanensis TaxID=88456 RepID=A0A6P6RU18_9EIME|nr:sodium-dependent phosphate transporter 1 [Cyclospora cayetanensis]
MNNNPNTPGHNPERLDESVGGGTCATLKGRVKGSGDGIRVDPVDTAEGSGASSVPPPDIFAAPQNACMQQQHPRLDSAFSDSSGSVLSERCDKTVKQRLYHAWKSMPWFKDIHAEGAEENEFVERLQNDVETFDVETEIFFSACQVASACMGCIAHSANDTANAVGPFAAILTLYQHGIGSSVTCPWYILLFGGLAMSMGLALLGYRVIKTVGVKLVKITPARGFSMELGAAWTVLIFSAVGIPLSTTHCAVGSTVGVGLLEPQQSPLPLREGLKTCPPRFPCLNTASVNWKLFGGMVASWIVTILFSSVVSASLFSFAAYSPRISI